MDNLPPDSGDIRCFCSRRPLLAKYGRDSDGLLFVHAKIYKQKRIYGEFVFTEGTVRLRCRECLRWYVLRIRQDKDLRVNQEPLPEPVSEMLA